MNGLFGNILTREMCILAASVIVIMLFIGRIPIKKATMKLNETIFWKNWGKFILLAFCIAGSFMPGVHDIPYNDWGGIIVFALVSSAAAYYGRAILKPIFLRRLEGKESIKKE